MIEEKQKTVATYAASATQSSALQTARGNLAAWQADIEIQHELSLLQVAHAARAFAANEDLSQHSPMALKQFAEELLEREPLSTPLQRAQLLTERLALCRALHERPLAIREEANDSTPTKAPVAQGGAVAMLSSPFFNTALAAFSTVISNASPWVCQSFADICEEVAASNADFGILPLEDTVEGKLFRIYEQIERFELHIACTADVPTEEDGKTVRVALLYKSEPPAAKPIGERILECLLYRESEHSLSELLTVASAFDLTLRRVDSLPVSYREDGFVEHLVFRAKNDGVQLFTTYLTLFMPRTLITADYINMKAKGGSQ